MQRPKPSESGHVPSSHPFCILCRRSGGATLTQCETCHSHIHRECRENAPSPEFTVAACPTCNIMYRSTVSYSNVPLTQLNNLSQLPLQPQPQPQPQPRSEQQQQCSFNTSIAANIQPPQPPDHQQESTFQFLTAPLHPLIAAPLVNISDGTVNPADLSVDPSLQTQAGQPGFEARRLARAMQATTTSQQETVQTVQPPADQSAGIDTRVPRPNCQHPPGRSCDSCMPSGRPRQGGSA